MARKHYITGIFNYCDYWCDRCAFTRRCRSFDMEDEERRDRLLAARMGGDSEDDKPDATGLDGCVDVDEVLRVGRALLEAELMARSPLNEFGETPDPADAWKDEADANEDEEQAFDAFCVADAERGRKADAHPVNAMAHAYGRAVGDWLTAVLPEFRQLVDQLIGRVKAGIGDSDPVDELDRLEDLIDVVSWYHTLLPPKAFRMVSGLLRAHPGGVPGSFDEDVLGCAKLLLVSADRSIDAWTGLIQILPQQEDRILPLLLRLDHLRREIERAVPGARAWRRPGLDDPDAFRSFWM